MKAVRMVSTEQATFRGNLEKVPFLGVYADQHLG